MSGALAAVKALLPAHNKYRGLEARYTRPHKSKDELDSSSIAHSLVQSNRPLLCTHDIEHCIMPDQRDDLACSSLLSLRLSCACFKKLELRYCNLT